MSGEIVVSETPNWLQELEAKREKRLKVKLGHEAGAGAPCLKCGEGCPGLDLHFWRKCCKLCKCPKEEHEVQDDDIYGWAQFQLVGSKPNKGRKKILLPGKKDELVLDWAPKGHNETVDKYLQTLSPEQLPVKGSQAAQDRKQLLQKQIPIHDIDPTLCHDLTEDELKKMNEYIAHVKQSSAGVGQIISLSSIIKGNLHMLNPTEAAIMANRYAKGIPLSEIVKLQSQSKAVPLQQKELTQNMEKVNLNEKSLPNFVPNSLNQSENSVDPLVSNRIHDRNYPSYSNDSTRPMPCVQFAGELDPHKYRANNHNQSLLDPTIDPTYLQNPNFDSKNRPSQFLPQSMPYNLPYPGQNALSDKNSVTFDPGSSAFVPYHRISNTVKPGKSYVQTNSSVDPSSSNDLRGHREHISNNMKAGDQSMDNLNLLDPNYSKTISPRFKHQVGRGPQDPYPIRKGNDTFSNDQLMENLDPLDPNYFNTNSPGSKYQESGGSLVGRGLQDLYPIQKGVDMITNDQTMENIDPLDPNYSKIIHPEIKYQESGSSLVGRAPQNVNFMWKGNDRPGNHNPMNISPLDPNYSKIISPAYKYQESNVSAVGSPRDMYSIGKGTDAFENNIPYDELLGRQSPQQNQNTGHGIGERFGNMNTSTKNPVNQMFQSSGQDNPEKNFINTPIMDEFGAEEIRENTTNLKNSSKKLPNYAPGRYSTHSDIQSPTKIPKSFRDLAFSTYDSDNTNPNELDDTENEFKFGHYRQPGSYPENQKSFSRGEAPKNSNGFRPIQVNSKNEGRTDNHLDQNLDQNSEPLQQNQNSDINRFSNNDNYSKMAGPISTDEDLQNLPHFRDFKKSSNNNDPSPYEKQGFNNPKQSGKKLAEMHPGSLRVEEDFLHPSQVNVGLIQDISYPEIMAATQGTNDFYEDYSPDSIREILNNMKLPDCHYCKRPFEEKEFAITIERANVLFHAGCFKCAGCNQILADNMYFYNKESDNIYCLRDYAKIRGFPRCKACDELIFTKEYCLAENSTFHLKHFCCIGCDTPLAGKDYTLEEEMPYCLPCYEESKASKCSSCCKVIKPDEVGCTLNDVHFHANDECFACKVCKKPLMKKKMLLRNQKLYCSHECYRTET